MKVIDLAGKKFESTVYGAVKKLPLSFRWTCFGTIWDGITPPKTELMKNRKSWASYKKLMEVAPPGANLRYEEYLNNIKLAIKADGAPKEEIIKAVQKDTHLFYKPNRVHCPDITMRPHYQEMINVVDLWATSKVKIVYITELTDLLKDVEEMRQREKKNIMDKLGLMDG